MGDWGSLPSAFSHQTDCRKFCFTITRRRKKRNHSSFSACVLRVFENGIKGKNSFLESARQRGNCLTGLVVDKYTLFKSWHCLCNGNGMLNTEVFFLIQADSGTFALLFPLVFNKERHWLCQKNPKVCAVTSNTNVSMSSRLPRLLPKLLEVLLCNKCDSSAHLSGCSSLKLLLHLDLECKGKRTAHHFWWNALHITSKDSWQKICKLSNPQKPHILSPEVQIQCVLCRMLETFVEPKPHLRWTQSCSTQGGLLVGRFQEPRNGWMDSLQSDHNSTNSDLHCKACAGMLTAGQTRHKTAGKNAGASCAILKWISQWFFCHLADRIVASNVYF